jgi:twitching motility protein PilT
VGSHLDHDALLEELWQRGGSDVFLLAGSPARMRVDGELVDASHSEVVDAADLQSLIEGLVGAAQVQEFKETGDCDFAFTWRDLGRVRASAYRQRRAPALALRLIPRAIPSFDEIGLPPVVRELIETKGRGFVLCTGATGSGKSTTQAAIIDRINSIRACHILTIEDPIEYLHESKRATVSQREIGSDSVSFARALRAALREDPDVILLGEMRDPESIEIALTLAETGHLVLATLHTRSAPQAIDRIIDGMPDGTQERVRAQLAASLDAVVAQRLLPRVGGGRVAAFEVMIATLAVRNLIREGRTNQLARLVATGERDGMISLDASLAELVRAGQLEVEVALAVSAHPTEVAALLNVKVEMAHSSKHSTMV